MNRIISTKLLFFVLALAAVSCAPSDDNNTVTPLDGLSLHINTPTNEESITPNSNVLFRGKVYADTEVNLTHHAQSGRAMLTAYCIRVRWKPMAMRYLRPTT